MEKLRRRKEAHQAVIDRIRECDPKTGEVCYTRFYNREMSKFDIDQEWKSQIQFLLIPPCNACLIAPPMRF